MISLSNLKRMSADQPPRILVYDKPKVEYIKGIAAGDCD